MTDAPAPAEPVADPNGDAAIEGRFRAWVMAFAKGEASIVLRPLPGEETIGGQVGSITLINGFTISLSKLPDAQAPPKAD